MMEFFSYVIVLGIGLFLGQLLPAYFKKKGENLATKEDIEEITKKIESIKAGMGSQLFIHQTRYQNEFGILKDLAEQIVHLKDATLALRPTLDQYDSKESLEDRKKKRLDRYNESVKGFYALYAMRKPFYPEDIFRKSGELLNIVYKEALEYAEAEERNIHDRDYWKSATNNSIRVLGLTDEIIGLIRDRVKYWEKLEV